MFRSSFVNERGVRASGSRAKSVVDVVFNRNVAVDPSRRTSVERRASRSSLLFKRRWFVIVSFGRCVATSEERTSNTVSLYRALAER